ncbi:MAG: autotransporter outer membrane beta-barrel domain-containing protein [Legionella sp.]|nr:autotransporter outer membrane beta-barrel domain-containing protein [Legionella sp.]
MNGVRMKKQALFISLLLGQSLACAEPLQSVATDNGLVTATGVYAYNDFKFDSTAGDRFNRYKGHMNFYSVGGNNVKLNQYLSGGLFVYWIDTSFVSQLLLPSLPLTTANQSISNNSIYAHVLANVKSSFFIDAAGGWGRNSGRYTTSFTTNTLQQGFARTSGDTWFVSGAALYNTQWKQLSISANAGILYTEVMQNPYSLSYAAMTINTPPQYVRRLQTNATYILENLEVGYQMSPMFQPFINGGLVQVADFNTSQRVIGIDVIGPVPAVNLDMNGYKIGGGLGINYKQYALRLEEQYFQRGGAYSSNQMTLTLRANFS